MALEELVQELHRSYDEAQERMADPAVYDDRREAAEVGRRLKDLEEPVRLAQQWQQARDDLEAARTDDELAEMVPDYEAEVARLEEELRLSLVERDPADEKDVIVEVRGGEGGEEGRLWAGDLSRILQRYAERRGFRWEQLDEGTYAVKGDPAYGVFKWEGGTHRVQRVPETESQGRIHTSTATVAVDVWMRPCDSVSGTRCTRCVPPSNLNTEYAPSPLTANVYEPSPIASGSTVNPRRSA